MLIGVITCVFLFSSMNFTWSFLKLPAHHQPEARSTSSLDSLSWRCFIWLVVTGTWLFFIYYIYIYLYIGNVIIPTHIFFRGVGQPPTSDFTTNKSTSDMGESWGIYVNHMALIVWPPFCGPKRGSPFFSAQVLVWTWGIDAHVGDSRDDSYLDYLAAEIGPGRRRWCNYHL